MFRYDFTVWKTCLEDLNKIGHLNRDLNQALLTADNLIMFADIIHAKGAALNDIWGFINGTVLPASRP